MISISCFVVPVTLFYNLITVSELFKEERYHLRCICYHRELCKISLIR